MVTFESYEAFVKSRISPETWNHPMTIVGLGLAGESGEVADLVKKALAHGHSLDGEKLDLEIGDVLWYIQLYCIVSETSLQTIMQKNIIKLTERYKDKFTTEESLNRAS